MMHAVTETLSHPSKTFQGLQKPALECRNVVKEYFLYQQRTTSLREWVIRTLLRHPIPAGQSFFTLTNFNMTVSKGESVALIGDNGSGKSTALRLMAGIYQPTSGSIHTFGRVGVVMELGAGFHMELTGAENVEIYAVLMGLTRDQFAFRFQDIIEFSELRDYVNIPVKYYSSGMQARLAFSVAICITPEILLLDEVLAVGDQGFREKCLDRLRTYHSEGGTLVIASHSFEIIRELCSRAVWLEQGVIQMDGEINEVLDVYQSASKSRILAGKI